MYNRIKEMREKAKIKQIDLANHLNVSQGTLSNWESGKYDIDNVSLVKLAKYFDCTTDYILCVDSALTDTMSQSDIKKAAPERIENDIESMKEELTKQYGNIPKSKLDLISKLAKAVLESDIQ